LGISLEGVRQQVEEIIGQGQQAPSGHIPFTPRAKKVLELSLREALQLGHNYIGTEHILLGLIREGEGVAAQVLVKLGADLNRVRQQVIQLLSGYQGKEPAAAGAAAGEAAPSGTARSPAGPWASGRAHRRHPAASVSARTASRCVWPSTTGCGTGSGSSGQLVSRGRRATQPSPAAPRRRSSSSCTTESSSLAKTGVGLAIGVPTTTGRDSQRGVAE